MESPPRLDQLGELIQHGRISHWGKVGLIVKRQDFEDDDEDKDELRNFGLAFTKGRKPI